MKFRELIDTSMHTIWSRFPICVCVCVCYHWSYMCVRRLPGKVSWKWCGPDCLPPSALITEDASVLPGSRDEKYWPGGAGWTETWCWWTPDWRCELTIDVRSVSEPEINYSEQKKIEMFSKWQRPAMPACPQKGIVGYVILCYIILSRPILRTFDRPNGPNWLYMWHINVATGRLWFCCHD